MGINVRYDRRKTGTPTPEKIPGATTDLNRGILETNPTRIVYVNAQTGDDGTGDGSAGNPFKTYAKGVTEVGATSKTHVEWMTNDPLFADITVPTQASIGVAPDILAGGNFADATTLGFSENVGQVATDGKGVFVAIANDEVFYSTDGGDNWTQSTTDITTLAPPGTYWRGIATNGNGLWIAIGGVIISSTDNGDTWSLVTGSGVGNGRPQDGDFNGSRLKYRNGTWIGLGVSGARRSTDGETFSAITTQLTADKHDAESDGQGNWVACGEGGEVSFSTDDGATWTAGTSGTASRLHCLATDDNGNWLMGGVFSNSLRKSTDGGATWGTSGITQPFTAGMSALEYNRELGYFIAASRTGGGGKSTVAISFDVGATWTTRTLNTLEYVDSIAALQENIVLTGSSDDSLPANVPAVEFDIIEISNDVCGFNITGSLITADVTLKNCTRKPTVGKALESSQELLVDQCAMRSQDDDAIVLTNNLATVTNTLAVAETDGKRAIKIIGTASGDYDIDVEFCEIIGDIEFDNPGSTGNERFQNSILQGDAIATDPMVMDSGNINGGSVSNVTLGSRTTQVDPKLIDAVTYRIQRESGYGAIDFALASLVAATGTFDFDSPLVGRAVDHAGASESHLTSQGNIRDIGAWSYDDSSVILDFKFSHEFPDPPQDNAITEIENNKARAHQGTDGTFDVANDPKRKSEGLTINWRNLAQSDIDVINAIERLRDLTVQVSLFPDQTIPLPSVTVNGNQSAGSFEVFINAGNVFSGSIYTIGGKEYRAIVVHPDATAATRLVLDRPLEDDISDTDTITIKNPFYFGEFQWLPPANRRKARIIKPETVYKGPITVEMIRKDPVL